jgi:hypothetical protein
MINTFMLRALPERLLIYIKARPQINAAIVAVNADFDNYQRRTTNTRLDFTSLVCCLANRVLQSMLGQSVG